MTQLGHGHNAERAFPAALLDLLLCHIFSIPPAVRHAWSWSMRVVAETAICECLQQAGAHHCRGRHGTTERPEQERCGAAAQHALQVPPPVLQPPLLPAAVCIL